jgi:hypothetical protein
MPVLTALRVPCKEDSSAELFLFAVPERVPLKQYENTVFQLA